jgi:hypothetical protein
MLRLPASMDSVEFSLVDGFWFKRRLVPSVRELLLKESSKSLPMQMYSEERERESLSGHRDAPTSFRKGGE